MSKSKYFRLKKNQKDLSTCQDGFAKEKIFVPNLLYKKILSHIQRIHLTHKVQKSKIKINQSISYYKMSNPT